MYYSRLGSRLLYMANLKIAGMSFLPVTRDNAANQLRGLEAVW